MPTLDRWLEGRARALARTTSRRSLLAKLGALLAGGAALPLLPVARAHAQPDARVAKPGEPPIDTPVGDPSRCEYWRHCAIDGFLCSCCGGSQTACPPGTQMSAVTWIGTCKNPHDGKDYIISYNDCCGKDFCGRCACLRTEGERPVYYPQRSNDINWCIGAESTVYHCSTAIVLGVAVDE